MILLKEWLLQISLQTLCDWKTHVTADNLSSRQMYVAKNMWTDMWQCNIWFYNQGH